MNLATLLTLARIFIGPLFLSLYAYYENLGISYETLPYILLGLLVFSEVSDALDGMVARRYDQVTDLGKLLDPMADSIARISIFLTFTLPPVKLPMLLAFVFLYRDSMISTLRTVCALNGVALAARMSGKIKAALQGFVSFFILILMILQSNGIIELALLQSISFWLVSFAALYTVLSGIEYLFANRSFISLVIQGQKS